MATQFGIDCALMAGASYISTRSDKNKFPVPAGWSIVPSSHFNDISTGFEAVAFQRGTGANTEIVISYAGTDSDDLTGDVAADLALGAGLASEQLLQAAEYYLQIKAINPDAKITLTGHSLGGGLASLVAVFFNETAVTFDQAPFRNAASWVRAQGVLLDLWAKFPASDYPAISTWLTPLERFISSFDPFGLGWSTDGLDARESKVTNLSVQGEFLSALNILRIGIELDPLTHGDYFGPLDLHSQALLTSFVQNGDFRDVTFTLTDLLPMIFDENLFENSLKSEDPNLLEHLIRHEVGGVDGIPPDGDKMLTRFTADLLKLAADTGLSISGRDLTKSLIAFAMQAYYSGRIATDISKQLYESISGGVRFERSDISDDPDLNKIKGYVQFFQNHLATLPEAERALIQQKLPELLDWYLAGTRMSATAGDQSSFMLGAVEADTLRGGTQADLLVGLAGNDLLEGDDGDDTLIGGEGYDTYLWTTGDGDDTLIDADKKGRILIDGSGIAVLVKQSDTTWATADGKVTLTQGETWKLAIAGGGSLDLGTEFNDGDYGITRTEIATGGALLKGDLDPILDGNGDLQYDAQGNVVVNAAIAAPGHIDTLHGSASADSIRALAGNDVIEAAGGNDLAEGGAGNDIVAGQDGADTLWGDTALTDTSPLATALAAGDTDTSQTAKGDWVDGGGGDDILIGADAQDLLSGGSGNDLLIASAGDDLMLGDATIASGSTDWQVARFVENNATLYRWELSQGTTTASDSVGGADVMYGGKGRDWAFGGAGDDLLDGGADDDVLFGEAGNDVLLGGTGDDVLNGDRADLAENLQGSDWIDGGDGNDRIFGMAGDDIIIGGTGNDTIVGGAGRDTYLFNKGDGVDTLIDDDTGPEKSIMVFGEGVDPNSIKLRKGSLLLDLGDGDAIHIENFDADNPLASPTFASFQFADGSSLTWEELLAKGFDLDGTDGDDSIEGTGVADRIDGRAGNDTIWGLDGDDVITGGTGTDGMNGGLGNDTYSFNAGDGATLDGTPTGVAETLADDGGLDTVSFAADIDPQHLLVRDNLDGGLLIDYHAPDTQPGQPIDRLLIVDGLSGAIERIKVGAGDTARTLDYAQLVGEYGSGVFRGSDTQGRAIVAGGKTDDLIVVADSNARVSAGQGSDTLRLTGTDATLTVYRGDGVDRLDAPGANATLRFADQSAADLVVTRVGDDVVVSNTQGDALTIAGWLAGDGLAAGLQTVTFADGTVWNGDTLRAALLVGTTGNDHLIGYATADTIGAGDGNDLLEGRDGDDSLDGASDDDQLWRPWIVQKSRHWRDGETTCSSSNGSTWRNAA
jgi:Ca2+-binding RTX toxin-like protein